MPLFGGYDLGKLREKLYSPIQPFNEHDEAYSHLSDQYKRIIDTMVWDYKNEIEVIVREQRYEEAADKRWRYKSMIGICINRFLEEMESYDTEISKYIKDK